ncbi:MAG: quinoprotein relay system zinc metallohydrolase 2 [Roseobacter sp.]
MFEAIIVLCLNLNEGPCRPHLLPGHERQTQAICEASLVENPPDLSVFSGLTAKGPAQCEKVGEALEVRQVAQGVFVHVGLIQEPNSNNRGDISNMGFVIGENSVAVIDAGTARWVGEALWRSIRQRTEKPVSHAIITHMHPDHAMGSAVFAEAGATIVGHVGLPRALADRQVNYLESLSLLIGPEALLGTRVPIVTATVAENLEIDLGNRPLDIQAWPTAHTGTDLTVRDTNTGTLFAGDIIFDAHTPALDGRLIGWRAVIDALGEMDVERVVPGHGRASLSWPEGSRPIARYLSVLEADTRAAVDAGTRLGTAVEEIAQSEKEAWELFETYNPRNATVAFTELEWE